MLAMLTLNSDLSFSSSTFSRSEDYRSKDWPRKHYSSISNVSQAVLAYKCERILSSNNKEPCRSALADGCSLVFYQAKCSTAYFLRCLSTWNFAIGSAKQVRTMCLPRGLFSAILIQHDSKWRIVSTHAPRTLLLVAEYHGSSRNDQSSTRLRSWSTVTLQIPQAIISDLIWRSVVFRDLQKQIRCASELCSSIQTQLSLPFFKLLIVSPVTDPVELCCLLTFTVSLTLRHALTFSRLSRSCITRSLTPNAVQLPGPIDLLTRSCLCLAAYPMPPGYIRLASLHVADVTSHSDLIPIYIYL